MAATSEKEQQHRDSFMRVADELWNKREYEVIREEYDPLVEVHAFSDPDGIIGTDAVEEWARRYHDAFSDFHVELFDVSARDDSVYARYRLTGTHDGTLRSARGDIPATHRKMDTWGIVQARYEGGLCVEEWNSTDIMTMLSQLGVAPE
ncbi:ester cyclase [Haloferax prahovense]|uniref:ester cyclase n=1 Tax=Haloferax TaxID=2251 RepID=UPI000737C627|nr:ester cyclase [Haloferax sp. Q22]